METETQRANGAPTPLRPGVGEPAEAAAAPPKKSRRAFTIVGVITAVILVGVGANWLLSAGEQDTDDAQITADQVPIAARVSGQVVKVNVKENQQVKKGEVIAQLDDADYAARLKQAEAELTTAEEQAKAADAQAQVVEANAKGGLTSARASYSGAGVGVGSAEAQLQAARAGAMRADADLKKAEIELNRARELRQANAVPQERLDNAQIAFESAKAAAAQAKANIAASEEARRQAEARVGEARGRLDQSTPIQAQIKAARAQADLAAARVKSAEAQRDLAKLNLDYTQIRAPFDGFASKLTAHEGQLLTMGQPVVTLVPLTSYVVANFKETQIGKMKAGQKAVITVDAFPGKKLEGTVESLAGGTGASFALLPADNASGNFVKVVQRVPVRIAWTHPPELPMRSGLSATVTVETGR